MRQYARVSSIDALRDFKVALAHFGTVAGSALGEAQSDVQRTAWWIEHEQMSHWQGLKKKRTAQLAQAKSELFRAQAASPDMRVSATVERKAVEKAEAAYQECETKIAAIKRWTRELEREILLYKAQCAQLSRMVEGDLPLALLRLDRMANALEQYVQLTAPTSDPKQLEPQSEADASAAPPAPAPAAGSETAGAALP